MVIFAGLTIGTTGLITTCSKREDNRRDLRRIPKIVSVSSANDLNQDGVADMVVETGYGKIPLYGEIRDGGTIYLSADEMKKLHPDTIVDYGKIEDMLNK